MISCCILKLRKVIRMILRGFAADATSSISVKSIKESTDVTNIVNWNTEPH